MNKDFKNEFKKLSHEEIKYIVSDSSGNKTEEITWKVEEE